MKILKHVSLIIIFVITITSGVFSYVRVNDVPSSKVWADDGWSSVSSNSELVQAFQAYCKSRNLAIEGSSVDAITSFTTSTFNNICNKLGIDSSALQAQIKKRSDGNLGLRWLFTVTGTATFNRIFAELLQNNNLSVGDNNINDNVYSGDIFYDLVM